MSKKEAIQAIVTGDDEGVGFRAAVMKQAIAYNLSGSAENDANNIVKVTLQGRGKRIDKAIDALRAGTEESSGLTIETKPAEIQPHLETFTIIGWTSCRRQITTPYTLIFTLRKDDDKITPEEAEAEWHKILEGALDRDDLKKLNAKR
ncbi:acylphosphatase [Acidisoma cellulosilytica]|uniref:acylphosphatase n=1 Tax=Acidisoma cellulosilyticum TaxID=2802395 RepID=A0A964E5B6_9PROT|nr:acylphosphatase [Acidisoma cellulosilyticum]MCB8882329.1 acylphosphatase [Acidisoma cellulosilyticum]